MGTDILSYGELDRRSAGLAAVLTGRLGRGELGRQSPVALLLPVSSSVFVGFLGVMKSGHFCVPLEPSLSPETLKQMLSDCRPPLLVATAAMADVARSLFDGPLVILEEVPEGAPWSGPPVSANALSSLLYTSGSTGIPRGVCRTHRLLMHSAYVAHLDGVGEGTRVAFLGSYAVFGSVRGSFGSFLSGGTSYGGRFQDFNTLQLCQWYRDNKIEVASMPPGIFRAIAALREPFPLPDLRMVSASMEPLSRQDVEGFWRHVAPGVLFSFVYGITECGNVSAFFLRAGQSWSGEQTPAGRAAPDVDVLIVGDDLKSLPDGMLGQIVVRARLSGVGYWNRPEETDSKYLPDPKDPSRTLYLTGDWGRLVDGVLEHRGRMDFMLKIRGHRVEPLTIENALANHPQVQENVVTAFKDKRGNARLVAYYLPGPVPPSADEIRDYLAARLSSHEVPGRFVALEEFPRLASGKVDRKRLVPPSSSRPELSTPFVAPQTDEEVRLAQLWAEILELDEVGIDDSFYQLGGDSLSAFEMLHRVEEGFGVSLPPDFYSRPTIGALTRLWRGEQSASPVMAAPLRDGTGRVGLFRLAVRSIYRGCAAVGLGRIFYRSYAAFIATASWTFWWIRAGMRRRVELYRWARRALPVQPARSPSQVLTINLIHGIWGSGFEWLSPKDLPRLVRISGKEFLEQARNAGSTIAVSYHSHSHRVGKRLLRALNVPVAGLFPFQPRGQRDAAAAANTSLLHEAEAALRDGRVVYVFPDGDRGTQGMTVPFLGVDRVFYPGFAELAVRENASVVAFSLIMDRCGRLLVRFEPAFVDDREASREARVAHLQRQYVSFLERVWKADIANVRAKDIESHRSLILRGPA